MIYTVTATNYPDEIALAANGRCERYTLRIEAHGTVRWLDVRRMAGTKSRITRDRLFDKAGGMVLHDRSGIDLSDTVPELVAIAEKFLF